MGNNMDTSSNKSAEENTDMKSGTQLGSEAGLEAGSRSEAGSGSGSSAGSPNQHAADVQKTSVPDYGSSEQTSAPNRPADKQSADRKDGGGASRAAEIDRDTDNAVKAGVGALGVVGLGAAILGE